MTVTLDQNLYVPTVVWYSPLITYLGRYLRFHRRKREQLSNAILEV
jgi:hypothetical protein